MRWAAGSSARDHRTVRTIARQVAADDYRFSSLVTEIVQSVPFQMRQGAVTPMIVTGKHLPRRTFLKGLGAAVALPMLDAMTPAFAARRAEAGADPPRLHLRAQRRDARGVDAGRLAGATSSSPAS